MIQKATHIKIKDHSSQFLWPLFIKTLILIIILILPISAMANKSKELQIGDQIPIFQLQNQNGELINIQDFIGKQNLVIYFYPKDDTPGCTKQACSFRDQYEDFNHLNAEVFGISGQSVSSHKEFAEKHRLNFNLLCDVNNTVRKQFGVPTNFFGLLPGRVTYVVDRSGKIVHIFNSQFRAEEHIEQAKNILKQLE
ncbi:peroxiredoxin [Marinifilum breve]|nr:peroxiredoxin [Marinifilum breve]